MPVCTTESGVAANGVPFGSQAGSATRYPGWVVLGTGAAQVGAAGAAAVAGAPIPPSSRDGARTSARCFRPILTGLPPSNTQGLRLAVVKAGDFADVSGHPPAED
jgi:hypothetical protein